MTINGLGEKREAQEHREKDHAVVINVFLGAFNGFDQNVESFVNAKYRKTSDNQKSYKDALAGKIVIVIISVVT